MFHSKVRFNTPRTKGSTNLRFALAAVQITQRLQKFGTIPRRKRSLRYLLRGDSFSSWPRRIGMDLAACISVGQVQPGERGVTPAYSNNDRDYLADKAFNAGIGIEKA
jgi:hypothetical protein